MSSPNKEIVQRFEVAGDANDVATIDEVCDPDVSITPRPRIRSRV